MKILHISAECYPAAKAGGLADVVGALPKYLNRAGEETAVIMPKHNTKWLNAQNYRLIMRGSVRFGTSYMEYAIEECLNESLGFPLYVVNCPPFFERNNIYTDENGVGFRDDTERWLLFQQAVIHWVLGFKERPKVLHCHDHHTALIPFMIQHCPEYRGLKNVPTVFTIHNGQYQGTFSWQKAQMMPFFDAEAGGLLEWNGFVNPLASALKCAWRITTVSPGYMDELRQNSGGLEWAINNEWGKSRGILNGIDADVWNPATDPMLPYRYAGDINAYKKANRSLICERFGIKNDFPIITFIGRIVGEKGADLLPPVYEQFLAQGSAVNFVLLGTGDPSVSAEFVRLARAYPEQVGVSLEYNEALSHLLYAGSDFLIMPSRVEPCGLNQMYALRYGTMPIVRAIGGLRDTVEDYSAPQGGAGIRFWNFSVEDVYIAIVRALRLYWDENEKYVETRANIMQIDNSWEKSSRDYAALYNEIL